MLGTFPTQEDVLSDGFDVRPVWWQSRAPESWSAFLSELPAAERGRGYRRITREDLFTQAHDGSPQGSGALLVACFAWGTGSSGWLVPRRARVFRDTLSSVLVQRLDSVRRILARDGPAALPTRAWPTVPRIGPSTFAPRFFTKFLYAADAGNRRPSGSALILDQFVALALNELHEWQLPSRGPWSVSTYQRWLEHAVSEAIKASIGGRHVRPDAVEMAYFRYGRELSRARRQRAAR